MRDGIVGHATRVARMRAGAGSRTWRRSLSDVVAVLAAGALCRPTRMLLSRCRPLALFLLTLTLVLPESPGRKMPTSPTPTCARR